MRDLEELKKAADKGFCQAWRYTQLRVAYEAQKQTCTVCGRSAQQVVLHAPLDGG